MSWLLSLNLDNSRLEHNRIRSERNGSLSTTLADDVLTLLYNQAKVLSTYILESGVSCSSRTGACLFVDGIQHVFQSLKQTQTSCRLLFLTTLEDSCAAANDFCRMSDSVDNFLTQATRLLPSLTSAENADLLGSLRREANGVVSMLSQDAVMAAERSQIFIIRAVQRTTIASDYFSQAWEEEWTQNEVTLSMVSIFDTFLSKIEKYFGHLHLYHKALVVSSKAMICFYIRCLISKADSVTRRRRNRERMGLLGERLPFRNHSRALRRISDDIKIMHALFHEKADGNSTLRRIVANEIYNVELIHECLDTNDAESLESFIVVIHKRTGADLLVTRYFVGDLWVLTAHASSRKYIHNAIEHLQSDLQMITAGIHEQTLLSDEDISFVRLDQMLKMLYEDRVAQGLLPACWACLPKVETEGNEIVTKRIRKLTRKVIDLRLKKSAPLFKERKAMS